MNEDELQQKMERMSGEYLMHISELCHERNILKRELREVRCGLYDRIAQKEHFIQILRRQNRRLLAILEKLEGKHPDLAEIEEIMGLIS